jgi:APA family basic amino acid/polyamine antiporter
MAAQAPALAVTPTERIEPRLSAFDASMVVVSLVIGIGIFRTPALVAERAGTSALFFGAWVLGGLVSLAGALTYAEIGSRLPRAGGYYRVVAEAYHPSLAFMLNWSQAILQGAGAAGVAFIGAEYLGVLLRAAGVAPRVTVTAFALMLTLLALNAAGIRTGSRTQNLLSLLKVGMILALAAAGLWLAVRTQAPLVGSAPGGTSRWTFLGAAIPVFYAYGGYQMAMNLAADVRDARRALPRAVLSGMGIVVALYLLVNLAYERVLGLPGLAASPLAAAALARAVAGPVGESIVALAIFLSAAGFVNATILQMPRSYYAMAEDGALPRAFLRVNPRTQVQVACLALFAATMLVPGLMLGSFEKLLGYVMFTDALTLVVVASTVFVLRRRRTGEDDPQLFRAPGYPWLPSAFCACLLGVALHVAVTQPLLAVIGLAIFAAGWPLFAAARQASGTART